jgi:hypothetical protein
MMKSVLKSYVDSFALGAGARHKNMTVFPISSPLDGAPDYLTLKEALERGVFAITEVSEGGTVPNLKVSNKADLPVLLLDGEELAGAKQNRVLNTTILVKAQSEVVVPVSCTEHGRWSYNSAAFSESGHVMSPKLRTLNKRAVAMSLATDRQYRGDQGAVWEEISHIAARTGANSSTGAMKDVFEAKADELEAYLKAFSCGTDQKGVLVMIGGTVMGFDFVSQGKAFASLFPKLIKSYAMEAWLESRKKGKGTKAKGAIEGEAIDAMGTAGAAGADLAQDNAKAFLTFIERCGQKTYDSVGMGQDVRFDGEGVVGSALVVDEKLIHMAVFSATDTEKAGNMAGMSRRRSFRT